MVIIYEYIHDHGSVFLQLLHWPEDHENITVVTQIRSHGRGFGLGCTPLQISLEDSKDVRDVQVELIWSSSEFRAFDQALALGMPIEQFNKVTVVGLAFLLQPHFDPLYPRPRGSIGLDNLFAIQTFNLDNTCLMSLLTSTRTASVKGPLLSSRLRGSVSLKDSCKVKSMQSPFGSSDQLLTDVLDAPAVSVHIFEPSSGSCIFSSINAIESLQSHHDIVSSQSASVRSFTYLL